MALALAMALAMAVALALAMAMALAMALALAMAMAMAMAVALALAMAMAMAVALALAMALISVPIFKEPQAYSIRHDKPLKEPMDEKLDLRELAREVFYYTTALQKERNRLHEVLRELAMGDFVIYYHREWKREILKEFFPDLLKSLPYYAGGGESE